jgi:hypothetical protein
MTIRFSKRAPSQPHCALLNRCPALPGSTSNTRAHINTASHNTPHLPNTLPKPPHTKRRLENTTSHFFERHLPIPAAPARASHIFFPLRKHTSQAHPGPVKRPLSLVPTPRHKITVPVIFQNTPRAVTAAGGLGVSKFAMAPGWGPKRNRRPRARPPLPGSAPERLANERGGCTPGGLHPGGPARQRGGP